MINAKSRTPSNKPIIFSFILSVTQSFKVDLLKPKRSSKRNCLYQSKIKPGNWRTIKNATEMKAHEKTPLNDDALQVRKTQGNKKRMIGIMRTNPNKSSKIDNLVLAIV